MAGSLSNLKRLSNLALFVKELGLIKGSSAPQNYPMAYALIASDDVKLTDI